MLVTRAFLVMGEPVVEVAEHFACCTTGKCLDPSKVSLQSTYEGDAEKHGVVGVVANLLHELVSDYTDQALRQVLEGSSTIATR